MADDRAASPELHELRDQITRYEEILRVASPRLAAFRQLEELARSRSTTPEAVAAEAANGLLRNEKRELEAECRRLREHGGELKGELTMLLQNRSRVEVDVSDLQIEYQGLQTDVVEILDELEMLRKDAARLMTQRRELETEVARLRREIEGVQDRRAAEAGGEPLIATGAKPRKTTGFEVDEDEQERRFADFFSDSVEHDKARDWILG